ncbi:hypothetical protein GCM10011316_37910 [Roseibium aquae]|uniref:Uncharacterized protein n=1 Tax=Roseibium aquae TaxID=1323746 RepID=A0A916X2J6_9HYPH|nr:hypothetical protein GCM10011316_37910 [Roseibium aquae]
MIGGLLATLAGPAFVLMALRVAITALGGSWSSGRPFAFPVSTKGKGWGQGLGAVPESRQPVRQSIILRHIWVR